MNKFHVDLSFNSGFLGGFAYTLFVIECGIKPIFPLVANSAVTDS